MLWARMKYLERTTAKGREYWYYRRGGRRWPLRGKPRSALFMADYERLHRSFEEQRAVALDEIAASGTFESLARAYLASPEYRAGAEATRKMYRRYVDRLRAIFGPVPVDKIPMAEVIRLRDKLAGTPAAANKLVDVMRLVFAWGLPRGLTRHNPADLARGRVKALPGGEHAPWPAAALERFRAGAPAEVLAGFELALHTGQRMGDCLALRWGDIEAGEIHVVQQKTGKELWVPIHPRLAGVLAALPRRAVTVLTTPMGRVWTVGNFDGQFRAARDALGLPFVFHGLRKNAAQALAEAGCSHDQIKAITGHSTDAMVGHYVKGASQRRLARSAMELLVDAEDPDGGVG